eukprot:jgi/Galph1/1007/GphlegSOOS_G5901.1
MKIVFAVFLFSILTSSTFASPLSIHVRSSSNNTIAAELQSMKNFTTLLDLAKIANLTSVLENPSTAVTLFAPTNEGITSTLKANHISESSVTSNSTLVKMILEYHIVDQPLMTSNFSAVTSLKTLEGSNITIIKNSTGVFVNQYEIIQPNIIAGKSVIQVIDGLLLPPTA